MSLKSALSLNSMQNEIIINKFKLLLVIVLELFIQKVVKRCYWLHKFFSIIVSKFASKLLFEAFVLLISDYFLLAEEELCF